MPGGNDGTVASVRECHPRGLFYRSGKRLAVALRVAGDPLELGDPLAERLDSLADLLERAGYLQQVGLLVLELDSSASS